MNPTNPGTYPTATFLGGDRYLAPDESSRLETDGAGVLGEGLLAHLCGALRTQGIDVGRPDASSAGGWEVDFRIGSRRFFLGVGCLGEPTGRWLLRVDEPRGILGSLFSRPDPVRFREALRAVSNAVAAADGLHEVRWYDPDDWSAGREDTWHASPVEV